MFDSRLILPLGSRSWSRWVVYLLVIMLLPATAAWGKSTSPAQAKLVVSHWLALDWKPLGTPLGREIKKVETFRDAGGIPIYHVAYLEPAGLVFVAGDDLVEPIIGYLAQGHYDPAPTNPLGALVSRDLTGRVSKVREMEQQAQAAGQAFAPSGLLKDARDKWELLQTEAIPKALWIAQPFGERVPPLVQSKWGQNHEGGVNDWCYNYYTPKHYPCGCAATALAQLMRYHRHPTTWIGTPEFAIFVDGQQTTAELRGGDGVGGPYDWNNMVLDPDGNTSTVARQAIGALTFDAGVAHNMHYEAGNSNSILAKKYPLVETFGYGNTNWGYSNNNNLPSAALNSMINSNLDARLPVILQVNGSAGSHYLVGDGYGYHAATLYHHLNLGWCGAWDLWYNLPNIGSNPSFDTVTSCWYNIYAIGQGEIVSGRVGTLEGYPVPHVTVKASWGGQTFQTKTNARGIYAFGCVPANSTLKLEASGLGQTQSRQVTTGTSKNGTIETGNLWNNNFTLQPSGSRANAYWQHGVKIFPEWPNNLIQTIRKAWGTTFTGKENTTNWFHIPLTTPVIEENRRTVLVKIFVLFKTTGNAEITNIHVWDGNKKIRAFDGLHLSGDHVNIDPYNWFYTWETMQTGVDIVVRVKFGAKTNNNYPAILFTTAGGDFYRWW
ncbi:MAG: DUF6623 family protein [Desulfobacteraceae bacterium]